MYCPKCGTQLPDDAAFCIKCGANLTIAQPEQAPASTAPILAPLEAKSLKCPHCGAPIWFARYEHKGNKIALVIDCNSASVINSIGL